MIDAIRQEARALGLYVLASDEVVLLAPLPQFWDSFKRAKEFTDGAPEPLDRFSKRIISSLASRFGLEAKFPSDGPPYPPFIDWALQADGVYLSPIGLLVHDQFGLWVSFRGAILLANIEKRPSENPCRECDKPCMRACPVNAFVDGAYDFEACKTYLRSGDVVCWNGCLARRVCPANHIERSAEQNLFHMEAFAG